MALTVRGPSLVGEQPRFPPSRPHFAPLETSLWCSCPKQLGLKPREAIDIGASRKRRVRDVFRSEGLFVPQRNHGIDIRRSPRGNEAGRQRNENQQRAN